MRSHAGRWRGTHYREWARGPVRTIAVPGHTPPKPASCARLRYGRLGRETEQHGTGGFAGRLDPISLSEVDEQAALRRRVDTKYVASRSAVWDMVDRLRQRYKVLEIDGRRCFDYESVYLDTPDLRCFRDHVEEVRPRFKIRTRLYRETGVCFLEVKVKDADDETTKRQCEYDPVDHGTLTQEGRRFVDEALGEHGRTRGSCGPVRDLEHALQACDAGCERGWGASSLSTSTLSCAPWITALAS